MKPWVRPNPLRISGVTDYKAKDDKDALDRIKILLTRLVILTKLDTTIKLKNQKFDENRNVWYIT
jgi:acetyl-CoA carboxylase carboxyltransferase component